MRYSSMDNIKRTNAARGGHWFEPSTMRFFHSRVGSRVYNGRYFISSEQREWNTPRCYTIRRASDDGSIDTVGEFMQYATYAQAARAIEHLADTSSPCANCRKPTYNRNFTCDECRTALASDD